MLQPCTESPFISFLGIARSSDRSPLMLLLLPWTPSATVCASVRSEEKALRLLDGHHRPENRRHLMRLELREHILMNAKQRPAEEAESCWFFSRCARRLSSINPQSCLTDLELNDTHRGPGTALPGAAWSLLHKQRLQLYSHELLNGRILSWNRYQWREKVFGGRKKNSCSFPPHPPTNCLKYKCDQLGVAHWAGAPIPTKCYSPTPFPILSDDIIKQVHCSAREVGVVASQTKARTRARVRRRANDARQQQIPEWNLMPRFTHLLAVACARCARSRLLSREPACTCPPSGVCKQWWRTQAECCSSVRGETVMTRRLGQPQQRDWENVWREEPLQSYCMQAVCKKK